MFLFTMFHILHSLIYSYLKIVYFNKPSIGYLKQIDLFFYWNIISG